MVNALKNVIILFGAWAVAQALVCTPADAQADQLSVFFYNTSCPQLYPIVGKNVFSAIQNESRVAASILRVHFHDCFVQGCDASVLLDNTSTSESEKLSFPNLNSLTQAAFNTVDTIKAALEDYCPNVVSCADVLTLAAFFSIVFSGGPFWFVPLGRRDSLVAFFNEANSELPNPNSNITGLKATFSAQKLSTTDLVALSGAHTIGLARCASIEQRLYNFTGANDTDPTINATYLTTLETTCPQDADGTQLNVTLDMDPQTPTVFDNLYYQNILIGEGLFTTDQELFTAANDTQALVELYAQNVTQFFADFAAGMIHMGNLNVSTGTDGEIRTNCRVANNVSSIVDAVERSQPKTDGEEIEIDMDELEVLMKKLVRDIILGVELEKLVEDTLSGTHASM